MTLIPPLLPPDRMPPVRALSDLTYLWRALMGPLGFSRRCLWLVMIDPDGRQLGLARIEDVPAVAEPDDCRAVVEAARPEEDGESLAVLLSRPGRQGMTDADRSWARSLTVAAREAGVSMWPVHLATDADLVAFAPDDMT